MSIKYTNTSNLTYELHDKSVNITPINESPNIHDILDDDDYFSDEDIAGFHLPSSDINHVDDILDDDISAQHVDYSENYTVKMLSHIANYYDIPKKK